MLGLEEDVVAAVLEDWRTAPIDERLRAVLGYLEKLTLAPKELNVADIKILHLAGLSDRAITEAAYVCYLFSVMDRLADTFDFDIPTGEQVSNTGQFLFKNGYKLLKLIR